ncbi:hypothetical protein AVEN_75372-1, partial [Araneus ventricosus]
EETGTACAVLVSLTERLDLHAYPNGIVMCYVYRNGIPRRFMCYTPVSTVDDDCIVLCNDCLIIEHTNAQIALEL